MKRFITGLTIALSLLWLTPAVAQTNGTTRVVGTCGTAVYSAGKFNYPTQDTTGAACTASSSSGGGASVTATAVAPTLTEGSTNNNISADLKGGIRFVPSVPGTGVAIDLSLPSGVLGKNGTSIATTANGLPVDLSINGAVPSLSNPIFVANAEAADATGTFTNATQTTSVTNSNADGYATSLITISGTYGTAAGVFEASPDSGATWASIICARSDGSASETGYTALTNTTRQWVCATAGNDSVRIRSTAVASGTVNVNLGISAPSSNNGVVLGIAQCATLTASPTYTTGTNNPCSSDVHGGHRTLVQDSAGTPVDFTLTAPTAQIGPYPSTNTAGVTAPATPETCSSGNVANATTACTLATSAGKTTYITGFTMTGDGATVGAAVSCTLTGTITGTMTYTFGFPIGVAVPATPLVVNFSYPVPASGTNTTIVVSCPASGAGGTNAAISATGFQL